MAFTVTVELPPRDRVVLRSWARSTSIPAGLAQRARIGLLAAEGAGKRGGAGGSDEGGIVLATVEPPPERLGVTHWSSRLLARELGVSNVKVADVWREWGLQPWRRETFKFSTDPQLEAKVRDIV